MCGRSRSRHVPKPWGHETIWAHTDPYVGKILHIKAGQSLSVQYHDVKDETVYLLSGKLKYWVWEDDKPVRHRPSDRASRSGSRRTPSTTWRPSPTATCSKRRTPHLDDVVRLKDRYGREGTSAP